MPPAIQVQGLSKQYRIGHRLQPYRRLGDVLRDAVMGPIRRLRSFGEPSHLEEDVIWALKDVSLEIQPGEAVGVIGANGAGKSTLLKILSQITYPTEGRVILRGRVSSLLEVGTGFHRELTGRENIFMSGAILGMRRAEITRKFDDIVEFAGVEKFVDTPVKRYSSGMQLRLAFAVAAHLEPEVLLVDEVLAVGDMQFQRKCLGRMNEVAAHEGRTIVFVSHNMAAIQSLCERVVVLDGGRIHYVGEASAGCEAYTRLLYGGEVEREAGVVKVGTFELRGVRVEGDGGCLPRPFQPATFTIPVHFASPCSDPNVHLFVQTPDGETIFGLNADELIERRARPLGQDFQFTFRVRRLPLVPGTHRIAVKVRSWQLKINDILPLDYEFEVAEGLAYGTAPLTKRWHGLVVVDAELDVKDGI
ncbi:MAG: ATP-binding cassette domain-containing protein [Phycisphaerae bacterium]|nr:ATP-binding cassette domain-containing protein [Phycisphaerae bacterium]